MKTNGRSVEVLRLSTKTIAENAIIACIYAVLTLAIAPLAYSEVQFRISEIIVFLAFYNKKWIPGLVIGCFLANLGSPLGWFDLVFGTFSTLLVCVCMNKVKNRYLAALCGAVITGILVGYELHLAFGIPFWLNAFYVGLGEGAVLIIGAVIFGYIERNRRLKAILQEG